jgi:hypothetical protein
MIEIKQSTAIDVPFFAHDVNGDGVTGIADGSWTKRIKKGSGAWGAMTVTVSEGENGWYHMTLSTSHTDTLQFLAISLSSASSKRVNLLFMVRARVSDDLATPTNITAGTITTVSGNVNGSVASVTGAVASVTGNVGGNVVGTVASVVPDFTGAVATDGSNSATSFKTTLTQTAADHWKDAFLRITSGTLSGQVKLITAYNGTTKFVTVQGGFTGVPADAVTFDIVNE